MESKQPKTYNIQELYEWYSRGELILDPKFQRRQVWPAKARSHLIDTILRDMPIPKLFVRQTIDISAKKSRREIVDGQQRLRAIFDFIDNKLPVMRSHNKQFGGATFSALPDWAKERFLGYQISTDLLIGADDADILAIFARINTFSLRLNKQELLNAEFFGAFKQTVYNLGFEHLAFWINNGILTQARIARMAEAELVSELLAVMIGGFPSSNRTIKNLYEEFDDEFPQEEELVKRFREVIDYIGFLFPEGIVATKLSTVTNFYSLFVLIYSLKYEVPGLPDLRIPKIAAATDRIRKGLQHADRILRNPEKYPDYSAFVAATSRRTTHVSSRRARHEALLECIGEQF